MPDNHDQLTDLQARVLELEQRVAVLEGRKLPPAPAPKPAAPESKPLESRLGVTLINRAGAVTLAIGILFFFKYAVDSRWIGAAGRVVLGIAAGLVLVWVAERLRKQAQQAFAQGVAACGIAVIYTAFYASFAYYDLLPQWLAFCGMVAAGSLSFALSSRYATPVLAGLGTAGALVAPLFLDHASAHPVVFFCYLLAVAIAVIFASQRRRWIVLLPLNAACALISAWALLDRNHPGGLVAFALVLAAVHFIAALPTAQTAAVRNWLLALGHACLLTGALRLLNIWAVDYSAPDNRASIISESASVFLAIYAVAGIAWGIVRRSALGRILGLTLLLAVVGKLYIYDVWQLDRFYRITAFVALGILLLAASYLYSRFREKLEALWTDSEG